MADAYVTIPPMPISGCTHCPARLVWATTSTGKRMPLDAVPAVNGNVYLTWDPEARMWRATVQTRYEARSEVWAPIPRHVHHVMTCPRAKEWSPTAASSRGAKPDTVGAPSGLAPAVHPTIEVRPVQEGMF